MAVRAALAAVMADGSVAQARTRVYDPQLRIHKPPRRDAAPARMVWVRIRDLDRHVVHEVSVQGETVTEQLINPAASPPFSDAERNHARQLLSAEPRLAELLAESDVEIEWFAPAHVPRRLLGARFVRVRDYAVVEAISEATVDVDDGVVVDGGVNRHE